MTPQKAIVCVEDESILLLALKRELQEGLGGGFSYETAKGGAEALGLISELRSEGFEVALIISDWLMPGMDGVEFLSTIRQELPSARRILITGHACRDDLDRLQTELGLVAYLEKPWSRAELLKTVQHCLSA